MEKVVLIDGLSILNRAFYGVPDLTNSEGLHTNAIYGFLNIMFKILEEEQPEYLAVAFDVHAPTFRHLMYAEYKGTRKGMPDELREQVPVMKELLKAMNICIFMFICIIFFCRFTHIMSIRLIPTFPHCIVSFCDLCLEIIHPFSDYTNPRPSSAFLPNQLVISTKLPKHKDKIIRKANLSLKNLTSKA